MTLGTLLKRYRIKLGLSQRQLSRQSGVRRALISELETGKKTDTQTRIVQKLAGALGVRTAVLLGEESPQDQRSYPHMPVPWISLSM